MLDKKLGANEQVGIEWARATLLRSLEQCPEGIGFDEMLYAPLFNRLAVHRFDNLLVDEAQDSNVPRILLAERMLAEGGRLFASVTATNRSTVSQAPMHLPCRTSSSASIARCCRCR